MKSKKKTITPKNAILTSYVQTLSIRNKSNPSDLTDLTNEGKIIMDEFIGFLESENEVKNEVKNKKEKKPVDSKKSTNDDDDDDENKSNISFCSNTQSNLFSNSIADVEEREMMFEFVKDCVKNLQNSRADNYKQWIEVGFCLRSLDYIHIETWIEFSKRSKKYETGKCEELWGTFKNDETTLNLGSLLTWLKNDTSPEIYEEFNIRLSRNKMMLSALSSPHNIAKVIKLKYKDHFLYADKKWFGYDKNNHRWRKMTNCLPIREKISDELLDEYSSSVSKLCRRIDYWKEKSEKYHVLEQNREIKKKEQEEKKLNRKLTVEEVKAMIASLKQTHSRDENKKKRYDFLIKEGDERLKIFNNIVNKLCSTSFKDNIMKEVTEIFNDPYLEKYRKFDTNTNLLGFTNGVLDLDTMQFREGEPDDCITFSTGYDFVEYNDDEIQTYIKDFMKSITKNEENMHYLFCVLAYMLHGCKYLENFWFLTGAGRNGKGTLMTLFKNSLGDYYYEPSIEIVTTTKQNSSSANPEMAKAVGKRVLVCSEPDDTDASQRLKANKLKQLRGNDPIQARPLYGEPFEFPPQFGMIFQMNTIPEMSKADDAIAKTLKIIDFPYQFVPHPRRANEKKGDVTIKSKFSQKEYYQQFMKILVEYYKNNVFGKQCFEEPREVIEMTQSYVEENNPLGQWINDNVDMTNNKDDKIKISQLYQLYKNDVECPLSSIRFGKDFSSLFGVKSKVIKGSRYYEGVCLKMCDSELGEENEHPNL